MQLCECLSLPHEEQPFSYVRFHMGNTYKKGKDVKCCNHCML